MSPKTDTFASLRLYSRAHMSCAPPGAKVGQQRILDKWRVSTTCFEFQHDLRFGPVKSILGDEALRK